MSTPPSTETFVTGDRVSYKAPSGQIYHGTLEGDPQMYGQPENHWWDIRLEEYGNQMFRLPASGMTLVSKPEPTCRSCGATGSHACKGLQFNQRIDIRDLPPISQETLIKHYEIRERELVQHITRSLEEQMENWQSFMDTDSKLIELRGRDQEVVDIQQAFDAGYLAGLRKAIYLTNELTSKLTKNPDE